LRDLTEGWFFVATCKSWMMERAGLANGGAPSNIPVFDFRHSLSRCSRTLAEAAGAHLGNKTTIPLQNWPGSTGTTTRWTKLLGPPHPNTPKHTVPATSS
jgi:hypothetical protein